MKVLIKMLCWWPLWCTLQTKSSRICQTYRNYYHLTSPCIRQTACWPLSVIAGVTRQEYLQSLSDGFFTQWTYIKSWSTAAAAYDMSTRHKCNVNVSVSTELTPHWVMIFDGWLMKALYTQHVSHPTTTSATQYYLQASLYIILQFFWD